MAKKPSNPKKLNPATLGIHGLDRVELPTSPCPRRSRTRRTTI